MANQRLVLHVGRFIQRVSHDASTIKLPAMTQMDLKKFIHAEHRSHETVLSRMKISPSMFYLS